MTCTNDADANRQDACADTEHAADAKARQVRKIEVVWREFVSNQTKHKQVDRKREQQSNAPRVGRHGACIEENVRDRLPTCKCERTCCDDADEVEQRAQNPLIRPPIGDESDERDDENVENRFHVRIPRGSVEARGAWRVESCRDR